MRVLFQIAVALLIASVALADGPRPGERAPLLAPTDAEGRALSVPAPGRVTLLSFASPSNGESVGEIARAIRVVHPGIEIVSFIDVSGYPRIAHGLVRREMQKRQGSAVRATQEAFRRAGKSAPPDLAERVHIIPDFAASTFASYAVGDAGKRPVMLLVGADGLVKARFEPPSLRAVDAAVASLLRK
jgi:hypothetical protein